MGIGRRIELGLDELGHRHPRAYRLARPPWRLLLRLRGTPAYWDRRRHYRYYDEVVQLAREHVPEGGSALDVGAHEADLLRRMDWFEHRLALDIRYVMPRRGVETVTYRWPADGHDPHLHDPVDEEKLRRWTGVEPVETVMVDDGRRRLIAVYRRNRA